jgi:hypothetical protein
MPLFRRKTTNRPDRPSSAARRGAVSVSVSGESNPYYVARAAATPPVTSAPAPKPVVERYEGTTIEPANTAALRISSAADVDPNVKKYGDDGIFKGGAGGYGGAGTK